jgi:hypothetical protein
MHRRRVIAGQPMNPRGTTTETVVSTCAGSRGLEYVRPED